MHFKDAVAAFETQLCANQRFRHTVRYYLRDLGMLTVWREREGRRLDVDRFHLNWLILMVVLEAL